VYISWDLFKEMKKSSHIPNVFTCNAFFDVLGKVRNMDDAFKLLDEMHAIGCNMSTINYNTLILGLVIASRVDKAIYLYGHMVKWRYHLPIYLWSSY